MVLSSSYDPYTQHRANTSLVINGLIAHHYITKIDCGYLYYDNIHCFSYFCSCEEYLSWNCLSTYHACKADPRFAPSQREMLLQSNPVSRWLGANPESALHLMLIFFCLFVPFYTTMPCMPNMYGICTFGILYDCVSFIFHCEKKQPYISSAYNQRVTLSSSLYR